MIVKRNCDYCRNEYPAKSTELKRNQGKYCSISCGAQARRSKLEKNCICNNCGESFRRKPSLLGRSELVFCSVKCANSSGLLNRGKHTSTTYKQCLCGSRIFGKGDLCLGCTKFNTFCQWWDGDSTVATDSTYGAKNWVKRALVELRGDRCEECGYDKKRKDGASIIQMDHIDGNCTNNVKENLKLLCPNCHAHTDTYGARNKGSGRAHRRKESLT